MSEEPHGHMTIKVKKPNPCKTRDTKKIKLDKISNQYKELKKECEEKEHGDFVKKYFIPDGDQLTHETLIKGLFNFYKNKKLATEANISRKNKL